MPFLSLSFPLAAQRRSSIPKPVKGSAALTPPAASLPVLPSTPPRPTDGDRPPQLNQEEDLRDDIILAMLEQERRRVPAFQPRRISAYFPTARAVLVGWILQFCDSFGSNAIACHACRLMDRVFESKQFDNRDAKPLFQAVAAACILLASKLYCHSDYWVSVTDLAAACADAYSTACLLQVEEYVLDTLEWDLGGVTAGCFLTHVLTLLSSVPYAARARAHRLLGLTMQHPQFVQFAPSVICAAVLLCTEEAKEWRTRIVSLVSDLAALDLCTQQLSVADATLCSAFARLQVEIGTMG